MKPTNKILAPSDDGKESRPLQILLIEDSEPDAELLLQYLCANASVARHGRAYSLATLEAALDDGPWDLVLCDYTLPGFDVQSTIEALRKRKLDLPFIVVSGVVGEMAAVEVMKAGAHDFIGKNNLSRLLPAIERELREAKLRGQRASDIEKIYHLAAIVDSTGEAIISQNLDGVITTWNAGAEQLFGYTEAEAVGVSILNLVPEILRAETKTLMEKLRNGEAIEQADTVRLHKDGAELDVYLTTHPIKNRDGKVIGASSIAYDIRERKRLEDERTRMIQELNDTLSKVKTLSGLLPICASCKNIRDDHGYWQQLETFVHEHSNAEFSHSICPTCMEKLYPDFIRREPPQS